MFFGDMSRQITDSMNAAATGKVSPRFQADCLTPNGLALRLGFTIAPLFAESGETSGMVITFQDLTTVRALEETSRRQDRMAAVGRMAASIAHEIRNPLAAMRGSPCSWQMRSKPALVGIMPVVSARWPPADAPAITIRPTSKL